MTNGWYMYPDFNAFYKVEGNGNEGRGFRWFVSPEGNQSRYEFFTFEKRTADFIAEGVAAKTVKACHEAEYLAYLKAFLTWQQNALLGLAEHPALAPPAPSGVNVLNK